jgi:hypothetical protein
MSCELLPYKGFCPKAPGETKDYLFNFAAEMTATTDTIASMTWEVDSGITRVADTFTTTAGRIWLSGGTDGTKYLVTAIAVTTAGRTLRKPAIIQIKLPKLATA